MYNYDIYYETEYSCTKSEIFPDILNFKQFYSPKIVEDIVYCCCPLFIHRHIPYILCAFVTNFSPMTTQYGEMIVTQGNFSLFVFLKKNDFSTCIAVTLAYAFLSLAPSECKNFNVAYNSKYF